MPVAYFLDQRLSWKQANISMDSRQKSCSSGSSDGFGKSTLVFTSSTGHSSRKNTSIGADKFTQALGICPQAQRIDFIFVKNIFLGQVGSIDLLKSELVHREVKRVIGGS